MAEFRTVDEATLKTRMAASAKRPTPRAVTARFDRRSHRVVISLDTGISFAIDPRLMRGLEGAPADDLAGVRIEGVGSTLHFPRLDADYTVSRLLEDFLGPLDWARREARASASRANGRRGGRPRRDALASAG